MSDFLAVGGCPPATIVPLRPGDNTRLTLRSAAQSGLQGLLGRTRHTGPKVMASAASKLRTRNR